MQKNVASQYITVRAFNSSTGAPVTGDAANITAYLSLDGGAATASTNAVSEVSATNMPGVYKLALTQAETNANCVVVCGKSSTANVVISVSEIQTVPANFSLASITSSGGIAINTILKKNVGFTYLFTMSDSTGAPWTGGTCNVFRSIDGAAFGGASTPTATEIGNGWWKIALANADVNGNVIALRMTGSGGSGTAVDAAYTLAMEP